MPNIETAYIELMLAVTSDKGKVIVVAPESFLFSKESKLFREKYLMNDSIEKVISLPEGTFKPVNIKTSIIVFNKNKSKANKNFIIFDGKSEGFEETKVKNGLVKLQDNTDLRASIYALKESKEVKSILSKYPQDEVKKIKDLVVSAPILGRNYSQDLITIGNGSNGKVPFIRVSELSKIGEAFTLNNSEITKSIDLQYDGRKINVIDFDAILVNLIGNKLKPTYFKFDGKSIVIGSDVVALKMKENINVEYFLTQLHSRLVQIQVEMSSSGTVK